MLPIGDDIAAGGEITLGQRLDLLLAEAFDHCQPQPPRFAFRRGLDRGDEWLDSLTERLAYACARTAPHPYRVIIAG